MARRRLSLKRVTGLVCCGALLAGVVGQGGCGGTVRRAEEWSPLTEQNYRRFSGGTPRIYAAAKQAMHKMGIVVTGERPDRNQIHGKLEVARQPIQLYVKIAGGNRVHVTVYNLGKDEADEWRLKFYEEMETAIRGAPSERPPGRGRRRRG